jgi:5-hydroxyisourate hydrolase
MSAITTHVLDTARGRPAEGIAVRLDVQEGGTWRELGSGATDADGRLRTLLPPGTALSRACYRLTFATESYLLGHGREVFFPEIAIAFFVSDPSAHHHVPLLLSPFAFSTYRGS